MLRWWDAVRGAGRYLGGQTVDANHPEHLPVLKDEDAGKLAVRGPRRPAVLLPALACPAVHGIVDAAGSELGSGVAQCKPDEGPSAA